MAGIDQDRAPAPAPAELPRGGALARIVRHRVPIVVAFVVASAALAALFGVPACPYVIMWITVLVWLVCVGNPHGLARFAMAWIPLLVILTGYDLVRSFTPDLIPRAVSEPQLHFDEFVFGGTAPTVTLQDWLNPGSDPHPWDYLVWAFYLSHFVLTPCFAIYLYIADRARFRRYAWVLLTVCVAGFATYFILPATPPWYASQPQHGHYLEHTVRVVQEVWANLGFSGPAKVFAGKGTNVANPVAALPSLHAAWPMVILLFVWKTAPRGRWLMVGYQLAMAFVLVYGGEHYVSDILLGYLYAIVAFVVVNRLVTRYDARRGASAEAAAAN